MVFAIMRVMLWKEEVHTSTAVLNHPKGRLVMNARVQWPPGANALMTTLASDPMTNSANDGTDPRT